MIVKMLKPAVEYVPSRMTILEGNMDWLANTPFSSKERGFFIADQEVRGVPADGVCGPVIARFVRK